MKFLNIKQIIRDHLLPSVGEDLMQDAFWIILPLFGVVLVLFIVILIKIFSNCSKVKNKLVKMKNGMLWNGIIRTLTISSLGYMTTFVVDLKKELYPMLI